MILVHGLLLSREIWKNLVKTLEERKIYVKTFELPGHGKKNNVRYKSPKRIVENIKEEVNAMGCDSCILVLHSIATFLFKGITKNDKFFKKIVLIDGNLSEKNCSVSKKVANWEDDKIDKSENFYKKSAHIILKLELNSRFSFDELSGLSLGYTLFNGKTARAIARDSLVILNEGWIKKFVQENIFKVSLLYGYNYILPKDFPNFLTLNFLENSKHFGMIDDRVKVCNFLEALLKDT